MVKYMQNIKVKVLSIVIPAYNESGTIAKILKKVEDVDLGQIKKEIIIVNDASNDGTAEKLNKLNKGGKYRIYHHKKNRGKGAALRTGFDHVSGDTVIVQDADLEYDPSDYLKLIKFMEKTCSPVVYGSRRLGKKGIKHGGLFFFWGGSLLNVIANLLYGLKITDEATCYKMFRSDFLKSLNLKCDRFEFCPEVTAKSAKKGIKIPEIPISYEARKIDEGKKIRLKDGIEAVWTLFKYRFVD